MSCECCLLSVKQKRTENDEEEEGWREEQNVQRVIGKGNKRRLVAL